MPDISDNTNWFELDSQNSRPPPSGWPEGQMPSTVNDCARANMGSLKRFWNRVNPVQSISGSGGVYTFTTSNPSYPTAYVNGEIYTFYAGTNSVGNDQFQVNTLGAKPIYKRAYSPGFAPLNDQDIVNQSPVLLVYESSLNGGAGAFLLINPWLPATGDGAGGLVIPGNLGVGGAAGINYSGFTGGGSDGSSHGFRFGWSGANLVVSVDGTPGLQLANAAQLGAYLPLAGGVISGDLQINGGGNALYCPNGHINTGQNLYAGQSVYVGGVQLYNNAGTLTVANAHISTPDNISAGGSLFAGGCQWYNNGGWMFTPQSLQTNAGFQANGGGTAINAPNGAVISGTFVQANGGGTAFYAPNGSVSIGGTVVVAGRNPGNLAIQCTAGAVEADYYGTSFYAPNGHVVCINCYANDFIVTSDAALKTGIADSAVGMDAIRALSPKSFRWTAAPEREQLGLIAQDVATVLPQAVSTDTDEVSGPRMGINYAVILAVLINAVKELDAKLEAK